MIVVGDLGCHFHLKPFCVQGQRTWSCKLSSKGYQDFWGGCELFLHLPIAPGALFVLSLATLPLFPFQHSQAGAAAAIALCHLTPGVPLSFGGGSKSDLIHTGLLYLITLSPLVSALHAIPCLII